VRSRISVRGGSTEPTPKVMRERPDEDEADGVGRGGVRDSDDAVCQRLAQHLALELGQLVQEENAVVGEPWLSRLGDVADDSSHLCASSRPRLRHLICLSRNLNVCCFEVATAGHPVGRRPTTSNR
jgi:hypothetical protein